MGDILENFIDETSLTLSNVRRMVDDYSLISHYLGEELELHVRYSSPLREDDEDPSFSLFYGYGNNSSDKLYFKDQGGEGHTGDVYDFLFLFLGKETLIELLAQINSDLDLGLEHNGVNIKKAPTIIKRTPRIKERPEIQIVAQKPTRAYREYWVNKYEITKPFLDYYGACCVKDVHYRYTNKIKISTPRKLAIAYYIGTKVKVYQPYEDKKYKFRNNYPANYIEGYLQLDWSRNDLLVITKAMKECIFFRQHWNIQAIAGKSESTMIPHHKMVQLLLHFKRVVVWLDPDETGTKFALEYKKLYPGIEIAVMPPRIALKDPTDVFEVHRKAYTTSLVRHVLSI